MSKIIFPTACAMAVAFAVSAGATPAIAAEQRPSNVAGVRVTPAADRDGIQRFIIKYRAGSSPTLSRTGLQQRLDAMSLQGVAASASRTIGLQSLRRAALGAEVIRTTAPLDAAQAASLLQQLRTDPDIEYAQIDARMHALSALPDDPRLPTLQWDMLDTAAGVNGPAAWAHSTGEGVVVAVLDTGVVPHPDLQPNLVAGYDFIDSVELAGDGDGRDADPTDPGDFAGGQQSTWHGTHVAGTVAAVANNGRDIAGIAYGARVQPVRVLGRGGGYESDIADAIVWASGGHVDGVPDNVTPADVINMSLGGSGACAERAYYQAAIDAAVARGTTIVVAAGNDARDASQSSPASCAHVISVGAVGMDGAMAYYSNHGASVTLAAPGGDPRTGVGAARGYIWSTGNDGATVAANPALLGMAGTSMASPHVAGIVALMQSAAVAAGHEALTPQQVRQMLVTSARPFPLGLPSGMTLGAGLADAARAVQLAQGGALPELPPVNLQNGVLLSSQTGQAGTSTLYGFNVPPGTRVLNLRTMGGRGDVSLSASAGAAPTDTVAQFRSERSGNAEAIVVNQPAAGMWYLRVSGAASYSGVSVLALAR